MFEWMMVLLLAHFTADFVLQTNRMNDLKKRKRHTGLFFHAGTHFLTSAFAVVIFAWSTANSESNIFSISLWLAIVLISLSHYGVDWLKEALVMRFPRPLYAALLFIADQIAHITWLFVIGRMLGIYQWNFIQAKTKLLQFLFDDLEFGNMTKLLLLAILVIIATKGTGYFLGILLRDMLPGPVLEKGKYNISNEQTEIKTTVNEKGEQENVITTTKTEQLLSDSPQRMGRYIGMAERMLIIIFIVQGTPQGLAYLIAVKSLTRFKQFESKQFAEYYLIGSLLSALIAVVIGYIVVRIL
ncbi:MAG TPA: DUF3307 domain-containing protein [Bacillales bacterium]|nr:DUF3307 domain-containing protein [Bacillales bacterium]